MESQFAFISLPSCASSPPFLFIPSFSSVLLLCPSLSFHDSSNDRLPHTFEPSFFTTFSLLLVFLLDFHLCPPVVKQPFPVPSLFPFTFSFTLFNSSVRPHRVDHFRSILFFISILVRSIVSNLRFPLIVRPSLSLSLSLYSHFSARQYSPSHTKQIPHSRPLCEAVNSSTRPEALLPNLALCVYALIRLRLRLTEFRHNKLAVAAKAHGISYSDGILPFVRATLNQAAKPKTSGFK
jgi:hypothetical protein